MSRKSQIHMLETIAVLAIFFILFMIGFVFYSNFFKSGVEEQKEENLDLESIEIAQRASSLPELQCSQENVVTDNCVDRLKLVAAKNVMETNKIHYFDKFGFSRISINETYPNDQQCNQGECVIYNRPLDEGEYSSKIVTNIPITIFDPLDNENAFGVMKVELFSK